MTFETIDSSTKRFIRSLQYAREYEGCSGGGGRREESAVAS